MRMRGLIALSFLLASAWGAESTLACGACVEDKVAATYDHAVVTKAAAEGHVVVFGEIGGPVDMNALTRRIATAAARVRGIDRGTVRVAASPPAFSFALDPAVRAPESAVAELRKQLHTPGATLTVLRVAPAPTRAARN